MANLLVADDSHPVRDVLRMILEKDGHQVILVKDGIEAREMLQQTSFDLAILDISMPRLSGLDLLKEIRMHEGDTYLPVILISAHASSQDAINGLQQGADAYLLKPFHMDEVLNQVRASLRS